MPLLVLSDAEKKAALEAADADLKFHLSSAKVAEDVQCALYHKGFITLPIFAGMDESRAEVRSALGQEIGLKHDADTKSRQAVALILSAWEAARTQLQASEKMKVESKLGQAQRIVQLSELAGMRKAVEEDLGTLFDSEVPAKSLIAAKLEQLEQGCIQVEDLREVLCIEDKDLDLFSGIIEHGTGTLKIRQGKGSVPLPSCNEELRHRHRLIGMTWMMLRTKHHTTEWLTADTLDAYRRLSDFVLGKHIASCPIMSQGGARKPAWKLVLSYEHEIRKKAYHLLRSGDAANLSSALYDAMKNPSLMNIHFMLPLNVSAEFMSDTMSADHQVGSWQPAAGRSKGKGKGGKGKQEGKEVRKSSLKTKTKDGKKLCFRFNNGSCADKNCTYYHACQICLGEGHGKKACSRRAVA